MGADTADPDRLAAALQLHQQQVDAERRVMDFGMDPKAERLSVLPNPNGSFNPADWTAPQWVADMVKALSLPGHVAQGGQWSPDDVTGMAMNVSGAGGVVPRGGMVGMGGRVKSALPMDEASRIARAREMGFDVDNPQFKGMWPYDWTKEVGNYKGPEITEINRKTPFPAFNKGEEGVEGVAGFMGDDPAVASRFAYALNGAVYPLFIKRGRELVIDAKGEKAGNIQFGESGRPFRDAIRSGEYDSIRIRNTADEGNITVGLKPENIRSRFADFDPSKKDSADLLAAGGNPLLLPNLSREEN